MGLESYEALDPHFVRDLVESNDSVWLIARWLQSRGHAVTVNPQRIRPTVGQMSDYADNGDLAITFRVEVKRRNLAFTCREDYPYRTVFVDVCHIWDRAAAKPWAYIICNSAMTHAAIIMGSSHDQWVSTERWDSGKGRSRRFYECPKDLAWFTEL